MTSIAPIAPHNVRPVDPSLPIPRKFAFANELGSATKSLNLALDSLPRPGVPFEAVGVLPIDPYAEALGHASDTLTFLDKALNMSTLDMPPHLGNDYIVLGAVTAARNARNDVASGVDLIQKNGGFAPVTGRFNSALNWIATARNLVYQGEMRRS